MTDRGRDTLRIYSIDPKATKDPLTDTTVADPALVFSDDQEEVNEQATALRDRDRHARRSADGLREPAQPDRDHDAPPA